MKEIEAKLESGEEVTAEEIDFIQNELIEKTDNCVSYLMSLEDFEEALSLRKKQIDAAIKTIENKREKFNEYILSCMEKLQTNVIQGKSSCIKTRKPVDVVEILNEDDIPLQYVKTKIVSDIDKKAISSDLKSGLEIPGAKLSKGKTGVKYEFGK